MTLNPFLICPPKDMHENDPNSFIYNRPKLEIIQVLIKNTHQQNKVSYIYTRESWT